MRGRRETYRGERVERDIKRRGREERGTSKIKRQREGRGRRETYRGKRDEGGERLGWVTCCARLPQRWSAV